MNVVRHDHPGQQPVSYTVEEQEGILDQARGRGFSQQAASVSSVKADLDAFAPLGILPFRCARTLAGRLSARWKVTCWTMW